MDLFVCPLFVILAVVVKYIVYYHKNIAIITGVSIVCSSLCRSLE